jgi:hypothetical protein
MDPENIDIETIKAVKTIDGLFELWRNARQYNSFSDDGVIGSDDLWKQTYPKIAFLLKEVNDGFHDIRAKPYYEPQGNSPVFWKNLNMWKYITTELLHGRECTYYGTFAQKGNRVEQIAYINLKKKDESECEARPTSDDADIQRYVDEDWEFLNRQIEIIGPDILFCCGTFKYLNGKIELEPISENIYLHRHLLVVQFCHPSARKGYKSNFDLLHEMFRLIPEKYKQRSQTAIQPRTTTAKIAEPKPPASPT